MTDQDFLHAFESGHLSPADFHHRDHLRLAWLQVNRLGLEAGAAAVAGGIRRFAEAHGHHRLYHETLTRFWVRIVAHASRSTFAETLEAHPMLLGKDLPLTHWSRETLYGDAAREAWIEPDLAPLPFA
jgi:hypothetical protein